MTAPNPVAAGGIKLLVRRPAAAAAPTAAVGRLSLDDKKAAAAAAPAKGPSELYVEILEAAGGDVGAAAARIKELLAAGSRDAAALGGMALREGVPALHAHGGFDGRAGLAVHWAADARNSSAPAAVRWRVGMCSCRAAGGGTVWGSGGRCWHARNLDAAMLVRAGMLVLSAPLLSHTRSPARACRLPNCRLPNCPAC